MVFVAREARRSAEQQLHLRFETVDNRVFRPVEQGSLAPALSEFIAQPGMPQELVDAPSECCQVLGWNDDPVAFDAAVDPGTGCRRRHDGAIRCQHVAEL